MGEEKKDVMVRMPRDLVSGWLAYVASVRSRMDPGPRWLVTGIDRSGGPARAVVEAPDRPEAIERARSEVFEVRSVRAAPIKPD